MNPDIVGGVWTGEFDLNTLSVDGEIFESRKKKLRIQKYPDTRGRGLNVIANDFHSIHAIFHPSQMLICKKRSLYQFTTRYTSEVRLILAKPLTEIIMQQFLLRQPFWTTGLAKALRVPEYSFAYIINCENVTLDYSRSLTLLRK